MKPVIFVLAACGALGIFATCNIWSSLTDCSTSSDCAVTFQCDQATSRCVPRAASLTDGGPDTATNAAADADSGVEAGAACDTLPWGVPTLVRGLQNDPVVCARFSADETTAFIVRGTPPVATDIYAAVRTDLGSPFRIVGPVANVNEPASSEYWPTISADGRLMFFESSRSREPNEAGVYESVAAHIWSTSRVNPLADFDKPRLQQLFDVTGAESAPYLHPGGLSLYFASIARPGKGQLDIFVADINPSGVVTDVHNIEGANTADSENAPVVSLDERYLYHNRPGESGSPYDNDIYVAKRTTTADGFGRSVRVPELSSPFDDYPSWVSPDHCRIYFSSTRPAAGSPDADIGHFRLWVAERIR